MESVPEVNNFEVALPKASVLVVDDNVDTLRSMAAILEVLNEEVLTASNANQALKYLLTKEPAVIVLDVMMPEMDGFQLASLIRKRERFKHTPIIFLTGLGKEDSQMLQGYQAGAVDYLIKPVDPDVLRSKVRIFVELAKKTEMLRRYAELMRSNSADLERALSATIKAKSELEREMDIRMRAEKTRDRLAGQLGATPDFVAAMAEGAITLARDGSILYCNARFAEMLQQREDELIGSAIESCIAPAYIAAFSGLFGQGLSGRVSAELEIQAKDGERIPVQVTLNPFSTADIDAIAMVVTDLRHQKRSEQMLAEGRLAKLLLEHASSGMAVCDENGRITLASKALQAICGVAPEFHLFDDVLPLKVVDTFGKMRRFSAGEVLHGAVYKSVEVMYEKDEERPLRLLMSAGRILNNDGATVGCVITLLDVSERLTIEEALRRSEKLAAAGRIAGTLAHEINNPLSAVTNLLYLLQNSGLEKEHHYYVELAAAELARVSHIARNTLSFYREASHPVPVRLSEVLDSVLDLYARQLTDKQLQVERHYDFEGEINNFPGELRQVFSNMIVNAIDAVSKHGQIRLSVRACHKKNGASGVRVVIADRGAGISASHRAKLFEPFFTTKGERGTGLGLWVSHGIIQKQGGSIRVRSSVLPGKSFTVFSVFIPSVISAESLHRTALAAHGKVVEGRFYTAEVGDHRDGTIG